MDTASFKADPPNGGHSRSAAVDIHETEKGIEMITNQISAFGDQMYTSTEYEQLIPDYNTSEIRYVDIVRNSGKTYSSFGKATVSDDKTLSVIMMYENKPAVKQGEYALSLQKDGTLRGESKWYNLDGKLQTTYTFNLHRL